MKKIVSVILLFVFAFYIFTGCASERAYVKSGLSEIKCVEKLGHTMLDFNVYGKTSGITVPAEHKDVSMLFLSDQKSGTAYMEYLEAKKNFDVLTPVEGSLAFVMGVSSFLMLGSMGNYTQLANTDIWFKVFLVSSCALGLISGIYHRLPQRRYRPCLHL